MTVVDKKIWGLEDVIGRPVKAIRKSETSTKLFLDFGDNVTLCLESPSKISPVLAVKEMQLVETKYPIQELNVI